MQRNNELNIKKILYNNNKFKIKEILYNEVYDKKTNKILFSCNPQPFTKFWIDDLRPAPEDYIWIKSVYEAQEEAERYLSKDKVLRVKLISLDHDSGDYYNLGGDYIKFLEWLEMKVHEENWIIPTAFAFHTANPVGRNNMMNIVKYNNWKAL